MTATYTPRPSYPAIGRQPSSGYDAIAARLTPGSVVAIDGSPAADLDRFAASLAEAVSRARQTCVLIDTRPQFPSWEHLLEITRESTIEGDPYFSKLSTLTLSDLLSLPAAPAPAGDEIVIVYGPGAALTPTYDQLMYVDLAKRTALAGLGEGVAVFGRADDQVPDFRRMVFVDWPIIDRHRHGLIKSLDAFIDLADPAVPTCIEGDTLRASIEALAQQPFRTMPHFMPGAWGGQWMKREFGVHPQAQNLAWSYELIAPEAGVLIGAEAGVEVPLDMVISGRADSIMGPDVVSRFGESFPIRFDYLDTMEGQNLSVHCHPLPDYMKDVFGWEYTQHESYYLMDTTPGAFVYLGLREDTDVHEFEAAARRADQDLQPFEIEDYVNTIPGEKHGLYMIPAGTPHGSSKGNVVLEISATPYFYSLRIYDYLRKDLDGAPRAVHVERAFANLVEQRRGKAVDELVAKPTVVRSGDGWREERMQMHEELFFEVWRSHFETAIDHDTEGRFNVLTLVSGTSIEVESAASRHPLSYGETILVPAAVGSYRLVNRSDGEAVVVRARVTLTAD